MVITNRIQEQMKQLRLRRSRMLLRVRQHRQMRLVPNLFTLGNAFFGFSSIILAANGDLFAAAYLILLGALMDALDGRIARYVGATSDFGMQLDSLCDAISFCLAPAVLVYWWQLKKFGFIGALICALFLLAGLLRLARFNLIHDQQSISFTGVPTTIAGCFLATVILNAHTALLRPVTVGLIGVVVICLAALMVSSIAFPAFKKLTKKTYKLSALMLVAFTIIMGFIKVLFCLFLLYFLYGLIGAFRRFFSK